MASPRRTVITVPAGITVGFSASAFIALPSFAPEAVEVGEVEGAIEFEFAADPSLVVVGVSEGLLQAKSTDNSTIVRTDANERERMVPSSSEFFSPRMDRR